MNKFIAGKISLFALAITFAIVAFFLGKAATSVNAVAINPQTSVTICHATASDVNPYVTESPNVQNDGSLTGGHLNHTGPLYPTANWGDIIPAYDWLSCPNGYQLNGSVCSKNNEPDVAGTPGHYDGLNNTTEGLAILNNDCNIPGTPPTDLCSNIEGVQKVVPDGDYRTEAGECLPKTPVCNDDSFANYGGTDHKFDPATEIANNDLCSNEPTPTPTPTATPAGKPLSCGGDTHLDAAGTSCVSFSAPGVPTPPPATGQVLGASTMAKTGSFDEALYLAIMGLGGTISAIGARKAFKKARTS